MAGRERSSCRTIWPFLQTASRSLSARQKQRFEKADRAGFPGAAALPRGRGRPGSACSPPARGLSGQARPGQLWPCPPRPRSVPRLSSRPRGLRPQGPAGARLGGKGPPPCAARWKRSPTVPARGGEVVELKSLLRQLGVPALDGGASERRARGRGCTGCGSPAEAGGENCSRGKLRWRPSSGFTPRLRADARSRRRPQPRPPRP